VILLGSRAKEAACKKTSYALVDQLRSVDKRRITRLFGTASEAELAQVDSALRLLLKI